MKQMIVMLLVTSLVTPPMAPAAFAAEPCVNCGGTASGRANVGNAEALVGAVKSITGAAEGPSCKVQPGMMSCMGKELSCATGVLTGNPAGLAKLTTEGNPLDKCFTSVGPCFQQAIRSAVAMVVEDLKFMGAIVAAPVKATWAAGKSAVNFAAKSDTERQVQVGQAMSKVGETSKAAVRATAEGGARVVRSLGEFAGLTDGVSARTAVASTMDDAAIAATKKNPEGLVKRMVSNAVGGYESFMNSTLMCEKWEGEPFSSKCAQRYPGYQCATCKDKIAGFCGVVGGAAGMLGGTVLLAGGTYGVARRLLNLSPEAKAAMAARAEKYFGKTVATKGGRAVAGVANAIGDSGPVQRLAARRLRNTEIAQNIQSFRKQGQGVLQARMNAYREARVVKNASGSAVTTAAGTAKEQSTIRVALSYNRGRAVSALAKGLDEIDRFSWNTGTKVGHAVGGAVRGSAKGAGTGISAIRNAVALNRLERAGVAVDATHVKSGAGAGREAAQVDAMSNVPKAISADNVQGGLVAYVDPAQGPQVIRRAEDSGAPVKFEQDGRLSSRMDNKEGPDGIRTEANRCDTL